MADDLEYFKKRSASGRAQASHNVSLLLLEKVEKKLVNLDSVVASVMEYCVLSLEQLDAGSDLGSARVIRESALTKLLEYVPPRAIAGTVDTTLLNRIDGLIESTKSADIRIGLCLCRALCHYDSTGTHIPVEKRSAAAVLLKRALFAGQNSESPSPFQLRLMERVRKEKSNLMV
jgi:hypothetical protein